METNDKFKVALEEKKNALQECQKNKNIDTCTKCDKLFDCLTRKEYVKAVYESMSHGETGGFEF